MSALFKIYHYNVESIVWACILCSIALLVVVYLIKRTIQLKHDTEECKKNNYEKKINDFNKVKEKWEKQFEQDIINSKKLQNDISDFELKKQEFEKYKSDFLEP